MTSSKIEVTFIVIISLQQQSAEALLLVPSRNSMAIRLKILVTLTHYQGLYRHGGGHFGR